MSPSANSFVFFSKIQYCKMEKTTLTIENRIFENKLLMIIAVQTTKQHVS